jgi:hypothetical protein
VSSKNLVRWAELQETLPLSAAMPELLPKAPAPSNILEMAEGACNEITSPALQSAIWLYVDDLDRSHTISQSIGGPVGAVLHGIMHRREGDFWNSKYWLKQAKGHPAYAALGHDPLIYIDSVAASQGRNAAELVDEQRQEWQGLFEWLREEN